jgi:hypothetical protein
VPSGGRNTPNGKVQLYTPELAKEICDRISKGETLSAICREERMPSPSGVVDWVNEDRNGFAAKYVYARARQLEVWADEVASLADDDSEDEKNHMAVQRARLRVDARKWLLSKLLPHRYGDKVELTGAGGGPIQHQRIDAPAKETREEWLARRPPASDKPADKRLAH